MGKTEDLVAAFREIGPDLERKQLRDLRTRRLGDVLEHTVHAER